MRRSGSLDRLLLQMPLAGLWAVMTYACLLSAFAAIAWRYREPLNRFFDFSGDGDAAGNSIIGINFLLAGIACLVLPANQVGWWWSSRKWLPTSARIVSSRIEIDDSSEGAPPYPKIDYEFSVRGQLYTSDITILSVAGTLRECGVRRHLGTDDAD